MSGEQNFVIFMLDAADSREFSYLLEQNPEYRDIFADFTYYENTVGAYSCTRYAVPYILSGNGTNVIPLLKNTWKIFMTNLH